MKNIRPSSTFTISKHGICLHAAKCPLRGMYPLTPLTDEIERLKMIIDNSHNKAFHMRLTQKEYDNLHSNAKRAGLPLSTYMRFMMKACQPKEQRPVDWFKFYSQLCRIGNNLNQLTHLAHNMSDINAEDYRQFRDDFDKLLMALMDELYSPEKLDTTKIIREAKANLELTKEMQPGT